jgi:hypothetical protein
LDERKVDVIPWDKFTKFGAYAGLDLSTTTDLSAYVILSEPDELGDRYAKFYLFCPKDTIEKRSKEDRVPYQYCRYGLHHRHARKRDRL